MQRSRHDTLPNSENAQHTLLNDWFMGIALLAGNLIANHTFDLNRDDNSDPSDGLSTARLTLRLA
jgi:hypothetical protein